MLHANKGHVIWFQCELYNISTSDKLQCRAGGDCGYAIMTLLLFMSFVVVVAQHAYRC